jgi:hypothetical protein
MVGLTSSPTSSPRRDDLNPAPCQTTSSSSSPPLRGTTWSAMPRDLVPEVVPEAKK